MAYTLDSDGLIALRIGLIAVQKGPQMRALKQNAVTSCFDFGLPFVSKPKLQQRVQLQVF